MRNPESFEINHRPEDRGSLRKALRRGAVSLAILIGASGITKTEDTNAIPPVKTFLQPDDPNPKTSVGSEFSSPKNLNI